MKSASLTDSAATLAFHEPSDGEIGRHAGTLQKGKIDQKLGAGCFSAQLIVSGVNDRNSDFVRGGEFHNGHDIREAHLIHKNRIHGSPSHFGLRFDWAFLLLATSS
ncbi:hypothetical protein J7T55_010425 [Diaporthe amygdali]|uniref:uncharacterized protein n=1 Tax=Phomopsis amygdali TaxID=1214568 RepID=UPI0022FF09CD|nr:uncharacterized protein J7T55_010425 [Diaporthe amygdali]KAJ0115602.1 hypothetical protein J7T55_010425 [Diaporthe amygdali]